MAENHHIDSKAPARWRQSVAGAVLLLALMAGFYWKIAFTQQYTWFDHPDMAYLEIPRLQFQAAEMHRGRLPLWDPHIWSGQPMIGQTQPGPLFPLNLIFGMVNLKYGYLQFAALNWYWVIIHWLAGWFCFLLARDRGLGFHTALVAGVLFACGGFVGTVAWLDVVNGAIWIPLVMLFVFRGSDTIADAHTGADSRRRRRSAALGGLFLGIAWLSGHHEVPILLSMASAVVWLRKRDLIGYAVLFFVIAGLIASIQALPTLEFGRLSRRWLGLPDSVTWKDKIPYLTHTFYSLPPQGLLASLLPGFGRYADASPYIGLIPFGLAMAGVALRWGEWAVRRMTLLGALAVVYSMGVFAPLNGVLYALVPLVDKARIPMRAIAIADFALIVLAAYGLDALLSNHALAWVRRLKWFFGVTGLLVITSQWFAPRMDDCLLLAAIVALSGAALFAGWQRQAISPRALAWCLLGLFLIDLTQAGPGTYTHRKDKEGDKFLKALTHHRDVADYLRRLPGEPVRVHVDEQLNGANFGDWHGIDMLFGYVAGVSLNVTEHELHTKRTQDLFALTHFIGKQPDKPHQTEVFRGVDGLNVYRNPDAFPRVRTVHEAQLAATAGDLRVAIQDPQTDLRRTAIFAVGQPPSLERCASDDQVRLTRYSTDDITIDATMSCRGLVVLADTMFPGWQATVDGNPARIWEAYGVFRSVVVDAGRHEIRLQFRPWSLVLGGGLTALGLLAVAAFLLL
ncbi:MAG: hypothetical protein HY820_32680 [Acidobacteria bacterium]|nr:hypothetical protein [Acidobacteriota bacterium]